MGFSSVELHRLVKSDHGRLLQCSEPENAEKIGKVNKNSPPKRNSMNQLNQPNVFLHHTQLPSGKLTWQWKNPHFLIGNYICSPGPFFLLAILVYRRVNYSNFCWHPNPVLEPNTGTKGRSRHSHKVLALCQHVANLDTLWTHRKIDMFPVKIRKVFQW